MIMERHRTLYRMNLNFFKSWNTFAYLDILKRRHNYHGNIVRYFSSILLTILSFYDLPHFNKQLLLDLSYRKLFVSLSHRR